MGWLEVGEDVGGVVVVLGAGERGWN